MSQSSIMLHNSSTGPWIKACSSSDNSGLGRLNKWLQRGLPRNNSPSQPTVPAASASRSVRDIVGITLR